MPKISRRGLLRGGAGAAALGVAGVVGWQVAPDGARSRARRLLGVGPDPFIPDAAEGQVRLEPVASRHLGEVDLFTAVPAGHGDGRGLPVVVVLHGASASAAALRDFGLARFVTAAVEAGTPPFVLAGTDDGPAGWLPGSGTDPQAMLREELPAWLRERGYAVDRPGLWGWSRGGYGALRFAQEEPGWAAGVALFSPAVQPGDPALADLGVLGETPWGLWCGDQDPFRDGARALAEAAPVEADPWVSGDGAHTRHYWNDHTLEMFAWLVPHLAGG